MSKKIQELLCYCEENFERGNLEQALRCAVSVSMANPNDPEPYARVTAYRILLTAANNRTAKGEPDLYAVLGVTRESTSSSIERRFSEIMEVLDGETGHCKAVFRACDLVRRAVAGLKNKDKRISV